MPASDSSGSQQQQQEHMLRRPIVISGPSGTGKSTLLKKLFASYPQHFGFSISHTTRKPRPGEVHGREYFFVERDSFQSLISQNAFIEFAEFSGNLYGTSVMAVKQLISEGRTPILDIEMQGVKNIKNTDLNAQFIFIAPPSIQDLEKRLRGRGTETEESIQKRLRTAVRELEFSKTGVHDVIIINDRLDEAYKQLEDFIFGRY